MKTKLVYLLVAMALTIGTAKAQKVVRVSSNSYDISDNLDLEAVASLFGTSENLSVFERKLNDPKNGISNLDLNEDGYVDYLRVIETSSKGDYLVIIQAVLDEDIFQDVATIEVSRANNDSYSVMVIGNEYLYGMDYYIRPTYHVHPLIFGFFFGPQHYRPWHSPYHWGYYPNWYKHRRPYPIHDYQHNLVVYIDHNNHYDRPDKWDHHNHMDEYQKYSRNDYGSRHPERSFNKRHNEYRNSHEFNTRREAERPKTPEYRSNERTRKPEEQVYRRSESGNRRNNENAPSIRKTDSNRDQQRGSVEKERPANTQPQHKPESVRRTESRKAESQPERREQPSAPKASNRSSNNEKSVSEKNQQKEIKVEKASERRQSKAAETEKSDRKETKSTESSGRR
jgi:hypothetical protein